MDTILYRSRDNAGQKAEQNIGFWLFKSQGQESIFYHRKGISSHQTASFEILRMKIGYSTRVQERKKFFKQHKPSYYGHMHLSPWKFFRNQILLDYRGRHSSHVMAQNAIIRLVSNGKSERIKNKKLHTFRQGYKQSTEKRTWKCDWKL